MAPGPAAGEDASTAGASGGADAKTSAPDAAGDSAQTSADGISAATAEGSVESEKGEKARLPPGSAIISSAELPGHMHATGAGCMPLATSLNRHREMSPTAISTFMLAQSRMFRGCSATQRQDSVLVGSVPARPPGHTRVKSAKFVKSSTALEQCPPASLPELAVIGRSNVGKSSLVNALTNQASLAKVSKTPGAWCPSNCCV